MACDLEDEEGGDGEVFDGEHRASVSTTPTSTPMPLIETLVEQMTVVIEPEPRKTKQVITEQVTALQEHQRPGSELGGVEVVTEQPVRSECPPIR